MKKLSFLFLSVCLPIIGFSQFSITPNGTASQLANTLVATSGTLGVTVSNATLTCDTSANGEFTGVSNLGIANGIVLGNGSLLDPTNGLLGAPNLMSSSGLNTPGDADLAFISGGLSYDACVLEFDLQPAGTFVEFEYIFGSDEYPAFNCTSFNDIFAFLISGPGFTAPTNIALVPGSTTPVSINSINDQSSSACGDSTYYVNNLDTVISINGFTTPLIATANVTPGQTYHLKLAISDIADMILNSYVFLKANSLKSGNNTPSSINQIKQAESGLTIYPTEVDQQLTINNKHLKSWNLQLIDINGRVVLNSHINNNQPNTSINIGQLQQGMYLLRLTNEAGKTYTEKIIKY
ncbi:MAG: T9SS type A sorting domain-containing protein [Chitinophagaceae bacterium]|nr:T9SS type A sorting domain-containing protein [Chitinophagaceae bacterium]